MRKTIALGVRAVTALQLGGLEEPEDEDEATLARAWAGGVVLVVTDDTAPAIVRALDALSNSADGAAQEGPKELRGGADTDARELAGLAARVRKAMKR